MRLDIYTCSTCGEGFSVEEDKQPIACPLCESKCFEFSHTTIVFNKEDLEIIRELLSIVACGYDRETYYFHCCDANDIIQKIDEWRKNNANRIF